MNGDRDRLRGELDNVKGRLDAANQRLAFPARHSCEGRR
jgi:hypothetical protein